LDLTFQTSFRLALACKRKSEPPKIGQTFKAHWSSAQALFSSPPGRGLPSHGRLGLPIGFPQALAPRETNTQRFSSDFSATINSPEPPLPPASAVASHSLSLSGAARPPRKGTGPRRSASRRPSLKPTSRLWAQLAGLSFLNHCASTPIEIPSSCAWISSHFSVGIGSQRTPSSKIAANVVSDLRWGYHQSRARYFTCCKEA
jgi:hypothetical protein